MNEAIAWESVLRRDVSADDRFLYAVTTTGIYCRPSCPSRRPKRDNVAFFSSVAAAELAGFRACQRCRPNRAKSPHSNPALDAIDIALIARSVDPDAPRVTADLAVLYKAASNIFLDDDVDVLAAVRARHQEFIRHASNRSAFHT